MINSLFVNLPIANLKRSVDFFTAMGFTFNAQFTDETTTCMIVGENFYAMLIEHERFLEFSTKKLPDASTSEVLLALMVDSRDEVDRLYDAAVSAGGKQIRDTQDLGFMYSRAFEDLDGHIWELGWMDPAAVLPTEEA